MQIRCQKCHKPYGVAKDAVFAALDEMEAESLHHYDFKCPHCRRVNRASHAELLRAAPDWHKEKDEETEDGDH